MIACTRGVTKGGGVGEGEGPGVAEDIVGGPCDQRVLILDS